MTIRVCNYCGKKYERRWMPVTQKYCSRKCNSDYLRSLRPIVKCGICGKEFSPFPADIKRYKAKFCSIECSHKAHTEPKTKLTCNGCGKEFYRLRYKVDQRKSGNNYCSHHCFLMTSSAFKKMIGVYHPNWKGGHGKEGRKYSPELNRWKRKVLKRDKYKCVYCGSGIRLEVDHKWSYSIFPEIATKMWNGQTLCRKCHKKTVNYGFTNNHFFKIAREYFGIPNRHTPSPDKIIRVKNKILKQHPELLQDRLL